MNMQRIGGLILAAAVLTPFTGTASRIASAQVAPAAPADAVAPTDHPAAAAEQKAIDLKLQDLIDKGLGYLKSTQTPDGNFGDAHLPPGVTALVLRAMAQDTKYPFTNDSVHKGYEWLLTFQQPDGGIYKDILANYNTSIAISALSVVKDSPEIKPHLDKAVAYLKGSQFVAGSPGPHGEKDGDPKYTAFEGGFGYNAQHGRPDLSNEHFAIQALHDAGLAQNDPAFIEAQKFITRCQNRSESNDQKWAGNDGGFVYSGANGGDSEAEDFVAPDGQKQWRSYGSMTYAGIKSMLYAGITKDDPRVKAAIDWVRANWSLDENPGLKLHDPSQAKNGLYYYMHVMAKALHAYGEPVITDTAGTAHDWRHEMIAKLASLQQADGSWVGEKRWMENNPVIVTSYVVLSLEEVQKDLKDHPAK